LPDAVLSPPVLIGTAVLSAAALTAAARRSRSVLGYREAPLHGAATAFIFAAQALNFPLGAGTSAHLFGATLSVVLLGPASAMLVMFAVLLIQALLFQDGGITALGANVLNLAVLAVLVSWALFRWISALAVGPRRILIAAGVAGYCSTAAVGVAVALELALSGLVPAGPALALVGGGHAVAGLAEAAITVAILAVVARGRPELLAGAVPSRPAARRLAWAAVVASAVTIAAAVWLSSSQPDVLEAAAQRLPGRTP
ncbi:MAG TPA: energy-coupling factor ABC transporter permease, partial [Gemmatimonadales bacterium]|nr:energy-coupling factor ABC transporter permease [Gemmatimonadales bacterium]